MSSNTPNRLGAGFLLPLMADSLPQKSPHLRNPWDALALLCHAATVAVGFCLVGLGEEGRIDKNVEGTKSLPEQWNATDSSNYAFRYSHPQSAMQYVMKISRLGGKAIFNGIGLGDDKVASFDVYVKDFVSESSFPFTLPSGADAAQAFESLKPVFISDGRIGDLSALMKVSLFQKLMPGMQKDGYEESAHAASQTGHDRNPDAGSRAQEQENRDAQGRRPQEDYLPPAAVPRPFGDPLTAPPRRPVPPGDFPPPGFEDEHQILQQPGRGGFPAERRPLNIGDRDLYPQGLGPHDPLRIGGPMGGGPRRGGGGMHPTFDDPLFGGDGREAGFSPRAPPGARYDPTGPGDDFVGARGGLPRFPGGPGGGLGGPPNPFGGFSGNDFI